MSSTQQETFMQLSQKFPVQIGSPHIDCALLTSEKNHSGALAYAETVNHTVPLKVGITKWRATVR